MSTTNKTSETLSAVFADNHGPNKTQVHDGQYVLRILGSGSPRDFADGMRFQTPFYYDPSQGNLLIEQIHHTPTTPNPSPRNDVQSTPGFTIVAGGFNTQATVGTRFTGLPVYQFEFAAPPPGDFNQDGSVDAADYVVRANFGEAAGSGAARHPVGASVAPPSAVPEQSTIAMLLAATFPLTTCQLLAGFRRCHGTDRK
jgi:hypothetical protein